MSFSFLYPPFKIFVFIAKELAFDEKVFVEQVDIYETYNPGAVVRIWCCDVSPEEITPNGPAARSGMRPSVFLINNNYN